MPCCTDSLELRRSDNWLGSSTSAASLCGCCGCGGSWYDGAGVAVVVTGVPGSKGDCAGELGERGDERGETERIGESEDDTAAGAGGVISGSETCGCKRCGNCKELVVEEGDDAVGGGRGRAQVGGGPAGVTRSGISSVGPACGRGGRAGYIDDGDDNGERTAWPVPLSLELVLRRNAMVSGMVYGLFGPPK